MFSPRLFVRSIKNAWRGLRDIARTEQSFRIQIVVAMGVVGCMIILPLQVWEHILLALLMVSVLVLEIVNSIFERLADAVHPRLHPMVREIKDMMAGAVLLASLTAGIVGAVIIFPRILPEICTHVREGVLSVLCT